MALSLVGGRLAAGVLDALDAIVLPPEDVKPADDKADAGVLTAPAAPLLAAFDEAL